MKSDVEAGALRCICIQHGIGAKHGAVTALNSTGLGVTVTIVTVIPASPDSKVAITA
jgi:hypothetical protein